MVFHLPVTNFSHPPNAFLNKKKNVKSAPYGGDINVTGEKLG
jgi:hypothetical protein